MGIIQVLTGILHGKPGKDGMWDFAGKRSDARARVELEKVRNEGTREVIRLLPPGAVLIERSQDWSREIHMPEAPPSRTPHSAAALRPPIPRAPPPDELEPPSARTELEPPPSRRQGPGDGPC